MDFHSYCNDDKTNQIPSSSRNCSWMTPPSGRRENCTNSSVLEYSCDNTTGASEYLCVDVVLMSIHVIMSYNKDLCAAFKAPYRPGKYESSSWHPSFYSSSICPSPLLVSSPLASLLLPDSRLVCRDQTDVFLVQPQMGPWRHVRDQNVLYLSCQAFFPGTKMDPVHLRGRQAHARCLFLLSFFSLPPPHTLLQIEALLGTAQ